MTAPALTRRISDIEDELETRLFERNASGMRLTAAGELFARFVRSQLAEADRIRSQIEDLKGLRRGVVKIACSQAVAHGFLPGVIGAFRRSHPLVTFDVTIADHERAMELLSLFEVDLVLVFRPSPLPNFRALLSVRQRLVVLMASDHPLASKAALRLSDVHQYPLALPGKHIGGRQLLDEVSAREGLSLFPSIQSNSFEFLRGCLIGSDALSFQMEIGALPDHLSGSRIVTRPIDPRDIPPTELVLGQLRDRSLPTATAVFSEQLIASLKSLG